MTELKIVDVIGYTSEDPKYPAQNLLLGKKWLCAQNAKMGSSNHVTLRLEKCAVISAVDIGNCGSSLILVEVSRMGLSDFETLVPTSTFMNAKDCKTKTNFTSVQMFMEGKLSPIARSQKWDVVRVTCMQPFCPNMQYGLSFIRIMTFQENQAPVSADIDQKSFRSFVERHSSPQHHSAFNNSRTQRLFNATVPRSPGTHTQTMMRTDLASTFPREDASSPSSKKTNRSESNSNRDEDEIVTPRTEGENRGRKSAAGVRTAQARPSACAACSSTDESLDALLETRFGLVRSPGEKRPAAKLAADAAEKRLRLNSPLGTKIKKDRPSSDSESVESADTVIIVHSSPESPKSCCSVQMDKIVIGRKKGAARRKEPKTKGEARALKRRLQCPLCTEFFGSDTIMEHAAVCNPEADSADSGNHLPGGQEREGVTKDGGLCPTPGCQLRLTLPFHPFKLGNNLEYFPLTDIEDHAANCEPESEPKDPDPGQATWKTNTDPEEASGTRLTTGKAKKDMPGAMCLACGGWTDRRAADQRANCSCVRVESALVHAPHSPSRVRLAYSQCPLCLEYFSQQDITEHAAGCISDRAASGDCAQLTCPVCCKMFPQVHMQWHIKRCSERRDNLNMKTSA